MNKKDRIDYIFEFLFLFTDLKFILLIVMLFCFYKETVLLADVIDPSYKNASARALIGAWERAGLGFWKWIALASLGDIVVKKFIRSFNE